MKTILRKLQNYILPSLKGRGWGVGLLAVGILSSCVDTVILPDDKTVDEDFWKSKSDVQLMVNGAYLSMMNSQVIMRLVIWGDLRSDELMPASNITGTTMEDMIEINLANTQPDNEFATWGSLYSVINNCNIVLTKAEQVMAEDPSYTRGDYLADCSQMLALRSLCYFYLVRNFRDVPYITWAFMSSDQDRNVPQSAPAVVLQGCIDDLTEAEANAVSANAYTDWRRVGYLTRDGIDALLADIYLWRGSVNHSSSDYQKAVEYCNKVIASKKAQHVKGRFEVEEKEYPLENGQTSFYNLFVEQNAEESIFELQANGEENYDSGNREYRGDRGVCESYCHYARNNSSIPYLYASPLFTTAVNTIWEVKDNKAVDDYRRYNITYSQDVPVGESNCVRIRKFVTQQGNILTSQVATDASINRAYTQYKQNYVFYRLTDIMLMKAEALAALATDDNDEAHLREAFTITQAVNTRSKVTESDSLKWDDYSSGGVAGIENLVLAERLRELAFEGKRWYDLMRYGYRHSDGVDYNTMLADQTEYVATNTDMLDLMKRKFVNGGAVAAKMSTEPRLYMPVPLSDLNICPVLKQNPGYSSNDNYSKNY